MTLFWLLVVAPSLLFVGWAVVDDQRKERAHRKRMAGFDAKDAKRQLKQAQRDALAAWETRFCAEAPAEAECKVAKLAMTHRTITLPYHRQQACPGCGRVWWDDPQWTRECPGCGKRFVAGEDIALRFADNQWDAFFRPYR